jgi:hypothetical protein
MYTDHDFKTKKALKEAVQLGQRITIYQPNDMFGINDRMDPNGSYSVEGPHYPKPHTWYARVQLKDGYIIKVT